MMVDEGDIAWAEPAGSFKYRTAAVIRDDDRLLVCAVEHINGWFLPGGKVQFGEDSAAALARELREELDLEVTIARRPLLITEGIRDEGGVIHQEVCFYYSARWPESVPLDAVDGLSSHHFSWIRSTDLANLRELLIEQTTDVRHLAFDRRRECHYPATRPGVPH
jgi:ADP-ribose pyrophosphatase YjhB (NUDIX family)